MNRTALYDCTGRCGSTSFVSRGESTGTSASRFFAVPVAPKAASVPSGDDHSVRFTNSQFSPNSFLPSSRIFWSVSFMVGTLTQTMLRHVHAAPTPQLSLTCPTSRPKILAQWSVRPSRTTASSKSSAAEYTESSDGFYPRRRFDCYRVERTSSRVGVAPTEVQRLSRRTVTSAMPTEWHN